VIAKCTREIGGGSCQQRQTSEEQIKLKQISHPKSGMKTNRQQQNRNEVNRNYKQHHHNLPSQQCQVQAKKMKHEKWRTSHKVKQMKRESTLEKMI
jgi:hypothetical protein